MLVSSDFCLYVSLSDFLKFILPRNKGITEAILRSYADDDFNENVWRSMVVSAEVTRLK